MSTEEDISTFSSQGGYCYSDSSMLTAEGQTRVIFFLQVHKGDFAWQNANHLAAILTSLHLTVFLLKFFMMMYEIFGPVKDTRQMWQYL